jgi:hypothetical protein
LQPFELRNVSTAAHREFVERFSQRFALKVTMLESTVLFERGSEAL